MKIGLKLLVGLLALALLAVLITTNPQSPDKPEDDTEQPMEAQGISMSFVGDILLASHVQSGVNRFGANHPFEKVKPLLSSSDFTVGNLESAVGMGGIPQPDKEYTFRADPMVLEGVKWSGIDVLSIANNHVLDFGSEVFDQTLNNISSSNLHYVGGGRNRAEAFSPVILEKGDKKIAVFAASRVVPDVSWHAGENSPGVAGVYDPRKLVEGIDYVRQQSDHIVVYLHWGTERETLPGSYQRRLARQLIDSGADVVVGTHPHVLQGFEFYNHGLIAYSLGNFVFTNLENDTLILTVNFGDEGIESSSIIPCMIRNYRPEPIKDINRIEEFYKMIEGRSFGVGVQDGKLVDRGIGEGF